MTEPSMIDPMIYRQPAELMKNLVRIDTTNPPGNEIECVSYIRDLLDGASIESDILAKDPNRPNLIARIKGRGQAAPLLMQGHVDVVTTVNQDWTHPPFSAVESEGAIWGRGTLDMKGGVSMMLAAFLRAKMEGFAPAGDLVLTILSDEEAGGNYGAKFLVEEHPQFFEGIRYAIGESGGQTLHLDGRRFYPVQIGEKQLCWLKAKVRGPGGHGSRPMRDGAMAKLGHMLVALNRHRLPVHITPVVKLMIETLADNVSSNQAENLRGLLDPDQADGILDHNKELARTFDALIHHTVNATIVHGGQKINVVPSEVALELDGRLLPGYRPESLISELRQIIGEEIELELYRHDPGPAEADMGLFDTLAGILSEADPGSIPMPQILGGVTDGRFFSRLGIQTYGFTPMKLAPDFKTMPLIHAADERIPIGSVEFGTEAIYKLVHRYK